MFEWISQPEAWIALLTLTGLEIVLGIDNIIFIAILVGKLPEAQRTKARLVGLALAMVMRILLLLSLFWIMKLTQPLVTFFEVELSGRDLILILGGMFLIAKSTLEIHHDIEKSDEFEEEGEVSKNYGSLFGVLAQIAILDIIFSLDSVITAVGMADNIEVMVIAVIAAVGVMMVASKSISDFVDANHTIKVLALAFLIIVGIALMADGLEFHIPKGYIYFAMAFSLAVESINIIIRKRKAAAREKSKLN